MGRITERQIARAKSVDILDYLMAHEPENLKRQGSNRYILRDHDSFVISGEKWYWNSRGFGCETATALNYLTVVRGLGFVDAVRLLAGDGAISLPRRPISLPAPQAPFRLPPRNNDNMRVSAYLQSRGIRRDVVEDCIRAGILYESAVTHYCVYGLERHADGNTKLRTPAWQSSP